MDSVGRATCFRRSNFAGILHDALEILTHAPVDERIEALRVMDQALECILRRDSEVMLQLHMEQATLILRLCVRLVNDLPDHQIELGSRMIEKFSIVFRTTLHDNRVTKKVRL